AIVVAVLVIFVISVSIMLITGYNSLVDSRAQIEADQSQIDIRLQERHDMLLQLIAAVGGLQLHEQAIYDAIVSARGLYDDAVASGDPDAMIEADAAEADALADFIAYVVVEDNPELTVGAAYYTLMDAIELTEGMLAVARRDYNESVLAYNTSVLKFPRVLYASMFGFASSYEYWKMNDGADEIPVVDFE
ncbi:MAG: LemA family protein, partial [Bacillota bacterium]|nr:LemA family protein [Bacillota bacterium]